MNILYLRTLYYFENAGGLVGHTSGVVNALSKRVKLKVVSNSQLPEVRDSLEIINPIKIWGFPKFLNEIIYNIKFIRKLKDSQEKPDFIYHRHSGASFAGAYLAKKFNNLLILEFNSSEIWKLENWKLQTNKNQKTVFYEKFYKKWIMLPIVKQVEKYNLKNAHKIIVVSKALKESLLKTKVPESKIIVYPNGIDPDKFFPELSGKKIRNKYSLQNKIVIGFIGIFGEWHGVIEMAKAIVEFYKSTTREDVKFLVIGTGKLFESVHSIIRQSDNIKNVIFTGMVPQNEAPHYLAACDILLSPHIPNPDGTPFFGSPTKLFEYMAMGKAIIASKLDQINEVLEHQKDALLVEPGNIEELVNSMKKLVENEKLRIDLGENAHNKVINKYTWDIHVAKILDSIK